MARPGDQHTIPTILPSIDITTPWAIEEGPSSKVEAGNDIRGGNQIVFVWVVAMGTIVGERHDDFGKLLTFSMNPFAIPLLCLKLVDQPFLLMAPRA